ncbi:MAG: response regulator [Deltaproteobacteria bacterium]
MKRIAIVDDDVAFAEETRTFLSMSGYEVLVVNDSRIAPLILRLARPDLIALDLRMDGVDGFRLREILQGYPETADIPVVAISGYPDFAVRDMWGMDDFLKKPFKPSALIRCVERLLEDPKKEACRGEKSRN